MADYDFTSTSTSNWTDGSGNPDPTGVVGALTIQLATGSGNNAATFLLLQATPTESGVGSVALSGVSQSGGQYQFVLELNEPNSNSGPEITLTELQVYVTNSPVSNLGQLTGLTPAYDLSNYTAGVKLEDVRNGDVPDYSLSLPTGALTGGSYVTFVGGFSDSSGGPERFEILAATPTPVVSVTKDTVENGVIVDGGNVLAGHAINWDYTVTNVGNVAINGLTLTDNDGLVGAPFAPNPVLSGGFNVGDSNHNGLLDPNETWQFIASGSAITGAYSNTVQVSATTASAGSATGSASSSYFGATPGITIDKQVSLDGSTNWADSGADTTPLVVLAGHTIYYQALVINTTTGGLGETSVGVTDNPALSFTNGGNSTLTLPYNSEATFTASTAALAGSHGDTATASGTVTDAGGETANTSAQDSAAYYGATAGITVDKQVSLTGAPGSFTDTTTLTPLVVLKGFAVDFQANVTNTTDGGLQGTGVNVQDSNGPAFSGGATTLAAGGSTTFTASTTALAGLNTDTVTAGETVTDGVNTVNPSAQSSASYYGATAGITVDKKVSLDGTTYIDGTVANPLVVLNGFTVDFNAKVTNTSDGGLGATSVGVTDNTGLSFSGGSASLASGGATTFTASTTALAGSHTDTLTAGETVTDGVNTVNPSAQDSVTYYGATAGITVDKQVSLTGAPGSFTDTTTLTPLVVLKGFAVDFQANVTNTTDGGLQGAGVNVQDSNGPSFSGGATTLAAGGSTTFTASTMALAGLNTDTVTAGETVTDGVNTVNPSAQSSASYYGATAGITVDKKVSLDGTTYVDGTVANPLVVLSGFTVDFNAKVTNTTDGALQGTGVNVQDSNGPAFSGGATTLAAGGSTTFTASTTALAGSHTDTVTAGETVTDGVNTVNPSAQDSVTYYGATAGITVDKQISGSQGVSKTWADQGAVTTPAVILAAATHNGVTGTTNTTVYYQALVQNTTDGGLQGTSVGVTDNPALTFAGGATTLESGASTTFTGSATATAGVHTDTATATETVTDGVNTANPSAQDSAAYDGATGAISVVKQVSLDHVHWFNEGTGLPAVNEGQTVYLRVEVTNTSTYGLTATGITVSDTPAISGAFKFGGLSTLATLASGAVADSDYVAVTAALGANTDTANASGTVSDSFGNQATPTATDTATFTAKFVEGVAGLSQGYWYNHTLKQTAQDPGHHWAGEAYVTGYGWGVLLGDSTGADAAGSSAAHPLSATWALAHGELFVPDAVAIQQINASQSANDTRQTLMSQAIAAQLNINNHDVAPAGLIQEAVQWLEGSSGGYGGPFSGFSDHSSGNVDKLHDGIVGTDDYNVIKAAYTFEGGDTAALQIANKALTSSSQAWQALETFTPADSTFILPSGLATGGAHGQIQADGEGLKNALAAFNQNQLVTDNFGHVAWDASGSTSGPFTYEINNGANDFWAVLAAAGGQTGIHLF